MRSMAVTTERAPASRESMGSGRSPEEVSK